MERLTGWNKGNAYYIECCARDIGDRPGAEQCDNGCAFCDENIKQCELLARYEDTGLTPEEITKQQKKLEQYEDAEEGQQKSDWRESMMRTFLGGR